MHRFSQQVGMRPLCISLTLVGVDEEFGPQVFRIDPSGQAIGFKGVSSGTKEQEAMTQLEKQFKKAGAGEWDSRKTVEVAIQVMQAVTSSDFKADEIEIGFSNAANPLFRKLTESEVETVLNDLADRN
uniref:Proteasome subunit alpha type n=1 Tax=Strombidium inclinatum TaxID=197538 RepID=A0A7S3N202_9SPIT|mmetsp:Transcript_40629/g.61914  ORF Transcript_40629/g.61914 Transcript_40629/m.61914 type:complete len:128 (+) Transcript_40629:353-736(+)